jgi:hypothetical protein
MVKKVLDLGCGCLRGGYWLIHLLEPGCYCGIEPNQVMLAAGIEHLLEPELLRIHDLLGGAFVRDQYVE